MSVETRDYAFRAVRPLLFAFLLAGGFAAGGGAAGRLAFADARAEAMGRGPALDAGLYALGTNPAMLVELPSMQFGFTHVQHPAPRTTGEIAGGAFPLGAYGAAAASFGTVLVGDVARYDLYNRYLGDYLYHDDRLTFGYGYRPLRWFAAGAAFHYDRHHTGLEEESNYYALGADAGAFIRTPELAGGPVTLAVAGENLWASSRQTTLGDYREPRSGAAGASWGRYFGDKYLTVSASGPFEKPISVALHAELLISARFAARGGVRGTRRTDGGTDARPAAGVGYNTDLLSFDYCYLQRELGAFHFISMSVNPGRESRTAAEWRRLTEAWWAEGLAYYEAGSYELAAERFNDVLKRDPGNADARAYAVKAEYYIYMARGDRFLKDLKWEEARTAFREALKLLPEDFLATEYLDRVDQLEGEERARIAEERRVAGKIADAEEANRRGDYRAAMKICAEILAAYPDHEEANALLDEARGLLLATRPPPGPGEEPELIPELEKPTIPAEAVKAYRQGNASLGRGAVGQAITILSAVVSEYPTYGAARAKLVEAYLLRGLEYYSKGALSSALKAWRRAQGLDPGNAKAQRYIKRAESEMK